MDPTLEAPVKNGVSKTLRVILLLLVVPYYVLSILYVLASNTFVAGIGIIPITITGLLSLSELGILNRLLPKTQHEYNIVLGNSTTRRPGYKLSIPWRLLLDITLAIFFLLIFIFIILEMGTMGYYRISVEIAFLGAYCTMPLVLGMLVCSPSPR